MSVAARWLAWASLSWLWREHRLPETLRMKVWLLLGGDISDGATTNG